MRCAPPVRRVAVEVLKTLRSSEHAAVKFVLSSLPEDARARMAFDLKHIILGYTSEVFRTIKESSVPSPEDESCRDEP